MVNNLKKYEPADMALLDQNYSLFLSQKQEDLSFVLETSQQNCLIVFDTKLKKEGFIGKQINSADGTDRAICRKQKHQIGEPLYKIARPEAKEDRFKYSTMK